MCFQAAAKEYFARNAKADAGYAPITFTHKAAEPLAFTRAFHGWSRNIAHSLDLGRTDMMLPQAVVRYVTLSDA